MSTATDSRPTGFRLEGRARARRAGGRRALVGVVLVVVCVAVFVVVGGRRDGRREVLVVTRPVPAGQVVTAGDVRAVSVSVGAGVDVVAAGMAGEVVGRPAAVPLTVGSLLGSGAVGRRVLPVGAALVGAALKPGSYPPGLAAGDPVTVLTTDAGATAGTVGTTKGLVGSGSSAGVGGVVVEVDAGEAGAGGVIVSVQVADTDAGVVARAAATGQVALVLRAVR